VKSVVALVFALVIAVPAPAAEAPVKVMVLGSYHFGNPGLDVNNVEAETVLTPRRQSELDRVARSIATFKPTRVMVEMQSSEAEFAVADYRRFTPERLPTAANEIDQLGFRIARLVGLTTVNGIDEQPKAGEPDYFPYSAVGPIAAKFGQSDRTKAFEGDVKPFIKAFDASQKTRTIAQLLAVWNEPGSYVTGISAYYNLLPIGDADTQPGADLNAMWYLRNAKIFGKLMQVAKPGDRVLVVYGAGHGYWLRHFAAETPGYALVDVMPYLRRAR